MAYSTKTWNHGDYTNDKYYTDPLNEERTRTQLSALPNELKDYINEMVNVDGSGNPIKFRLNNGDLQYRTDSLSTWQNTNSVLGALPDYKRVLDLDDATDQGRYLAQANYTANSPILTSTFHVYVLNETYSTTTRVIQLAVATSGSTNRLFWRSKTGSTWANSGAWNEVMDVNGEGLFKYGGTVDDANSINTMGTFYLAETGSHIPKAAKGYVISFVGNSKYGQFWFPNDTGGAEVWFRSKGSSWGDWKQIIVKGDQDLLPYRGQSDTFSLDNQGTYYMNAGATDAPESTKAYRAVVFTISSGTFILAFQNSANSDGFYWKKRGNTSWYHIASTDAVDTAITTKLTSDVTPNILAYTSSLADLNGATAIGRYHYSSDASHKPDDNQGDLLVFPFGANGLAQIAFPRGTNDMYYRNSATGTWQKVTVAVNSHTTVSTGSGDGNASTANDFNKVYKWGNVATVNWRFTAPATGTSGDLMGTLPEGYRPASYQLVYAVNRTDLSDNTVINKLQEIKIATDGKITMNTAYTASKTYELQCTFITA